MTSFEAGVEILRPAAGQKEPVGGATSGGEKGDDRGALIFAIFLIKPSPSALDEVDAPLDEANVGCYNDPHSAA